MAWPDKNVVIVDHEKAQTYSNAYINLMQNQIIARGLILTNAIQDFNGFLALPPGSSAAAAIFDAAFGLLSTVIPAFRLGEFISQANERAKVALAAAEAFGNAAKRADKIVKTVTDIAPKVGDGVKHVKDALEVKEKFEKIGTGNDGPLKNHASIKPVLALIKELDDSSAMWKTANQAEMKEFENRMTGISKNTFTLEVTMNKLLAPIPKMFNERELVQIKFRYLHLMISQHVQTKPITLLTTKTDWGYNQYTGETTADGWNDTQKTQIVTWFGRETARGEYFGVPSVTSATEYLKLVPANSKTVVRQSGIYSPRAKI